MKLRDQGGDAGDPFASDPFEAAPPLPQYNPPDSQPRPSSGSVGEINTLATLSVVFAFVFAPVGAVLGHTALSQIRRLRQPGRKRAILGLTLSYFFLVLAVAVLIVWLLLHANKTQHNPTARTAVPAPSVSSTVITPPPRGRPRVSVEQLRVGDCVEIQKNEPDPTRPNTDQIYIYRAKCEVRGGIFQVTQKSSSPDQCPRGEYLTNDQESVVACFVKFGSGATPS